MIFDLLRVGINSLELLIPREVARLGPKVVRWSLLVLLLVLLVVLLEIKHAHFNPLSYKLSSAIVSLPMANSGKRQLVKNRLSNLWLEIIYFQNIYGFETS